MYDRPWLLENDCPTCMAFSHRYLDSTFSFEAECQPNVRLNGALVFILSLGPSGNLPFSSRVRDIMLLKGCEAIGSHVVIRTDPESDIYHRHQVPITATELPASTGADACFDTIRAWMKTCVENHTNCREGLRSSSTEKSLPTRLIEILDDDQLRLIHTLSNDCPSEVQYNTLSYRWNTQEDPKLLLSNVTQWTRCRSTNTLPPVFQDAIAITRRLGILYIWIDALCIIQDNVDDWRSESALIGQVYQNSYLNLAASAAAAAAAAASTKAGTVGLYMKREPVDFPGVLFTSDNICNNRCWVLTHWRQGGNVRYEPLLRRGWIFQERLLSPRTVYFSDQLKWECAELLACECYPSGSDHRLNPSHPMARVFSSFSPFRVTNLLYSNFDLREGSPKSERPLDKIDVYASWLYLAQEYMRCDLTVATDRLPAISGLAKRFQSVLQDEYVAGLWKHDLLSGLLWCRSGPSLEKDSRKLYIGN